MENKKQVILVAVIALMLCIGMFIQFEPFFDLKQHILDAVALPKNIFSYQKDDSADNQTPLILFDDNDTEAEGGTNDYTPATGQNDLPIHHMEITP